MDFSKFEYAWDSRNNRFFGPFDEGNGFLYCEQTNEFIFRHHLKDLVDKGQKGAALVLVENAIKANLAISGKMVSKPTGPFYPITWERIPADKQRELIRLYRS